MKSCKEKAAEWGISSRSVNDMCKKGKVDCLHSVCKGAKFGVSQKFNSRRDLIIFMVSWT